MNVTGQRLVASIIMGCILTLMAQVALPSVLDGKFVVAAAIASAAIFVLNTGIHHHRPSHTD
jgi:hypothetical protein